MPVDTTHKPLPKPKKGEHRRKKKRERDAKMDAFRAEVMALDRMYECCNKLRQRWKSAVPPSNRSYWEVAHLLGKGRSPKTKYDTGYAMRLCWWCHDAVDGRHNELWPELTPDQRKVKILDWWETNRPEHYKMRGWKKAHDKLRASVARRTKSEE